ncbi:MAG: SRPBCC domain-containing protein [Porphyromonadaceae bacterium]|nr:SRPBCC domain-containing protein [Porphyromonadaceae bacterium]
MKKEKITLEYPLNYAAEHILWIMIGSPLGLSEWFSDGVTVEDDLYTFTWDEHDQSAYLLETIEGKSIRFQWEEDKGTDAYFEMKIVTQPLTGHVGLLVTEFAEPEDVDDLTLLWNKHMEDLRRKVGV